MNSCNSNIYDGFLLPSESIIFSVFPIQTNLKLMNWKDYFMWRDIGLESPIAALLHWTMTTYHIISNILHFYGKISCIYF